MAGRSYPESLLRVGLCVRISTDSLIFLFQKWSSRQMICTLSMSTSCLCLTVCSPTAVRGALVSVVVCSSNLTDIALAVSPTYVSLQSEQLILYTTPHLSQFGVLSFGCTKKDLIVLIGLWYALTPWSLKILLSFSEIPLIYGSGTLILRLVGLLFVEESFFLAWFGGFEHPGFISISL